ncbi:LytTR family DNA-binding domain-containing protein [Sphingobacterium faecium]|uniref:LytTR family DNA-binding domain-containing protein n=1 Tax=Sphingobacterium faecium TaxID=34087 RepID=UPI000D341D3E|nr:LytTR family DNA-binding domain-containing protein [Sphingobacterium faecium]
MMGRPDLSTFQALMILSYYPTLLVNYAIALIVGMGVKKVTILLDSYHDWYSDLWRRAMLQFLFGVVVVSILSFFLVWIYFFAFGQDLTDSGYLDYELPFSIALITILNFYYVAYYFYMHPRSEHEIMPADKQEVQMDMVPFTYQMESPIEVTTPVEKVESITNSELETNNGYAENTMLNHKAKEAEQKKEPKEILIVDTPLRSIPIKLKDVVIFFIYNKTLFIATKGIKNLGDCYQYSGTLSELMEYLDERDFFRINRQCIVNFKMIDAFENTTDKGLRLLFKSEYMKLDDMKTEVFVKTCMVSGDRVASFKDWMNR